MKINPDKLILINTDNDTPISLENGVFVRAVGRTEMLKGALEYELSILTDIQKEIESAGFILSETQNRKRELLVELIQLCEKEIDG